MARPKSKHGLYAEQLVKERPDLTHTEIGKLIHKKFPKEVRDAEHGRALARLFAGNSGDSNRKSILNKKIFRTPMQKPKEPKQYLDAKKKKLKKSKYYLISWAQNNTPIHKEFFDNLEAYAKFLGAEIHIVLGRYKNPTSLRHLNTEDFWAKEVLPYADAHRHSIHKNLQLLSDIKVQPTATSPLTALEGISGQQSCIIGHPKRQFKVVASLEGIEQKMMFTTGAVTKRNFTDSKAGKKGEFHFTYGFVIVEIRDKEVFFIRQVSANNDGTFTDLIYKVKDKKVSKINNIEYYNVGDRHNGVHSLQVEKQQEKLLNYFKPKHTIIHDITDGYSVNAHIEKDPIEKYKQYLEGKNLIKNEINNLFSWVDRWLKYNLVCISSNHQDWYDRYIKFQDWKKDIANAMEYVEFSKILLSGKAPNGIIAYLLKQKYGKKIRIVGRNDSFKINKISHHHGDLGINGAKGSPLSFKRLSSKQDIGHGHSPFVEEGVYGLGTSTELRLGYNLGASNWKHADIICHKDGKRQHIIFQGNKKEFTTFSL